MSFKLKSTHDVTYMIAILEPHLQFLDLLKRSHTPPCPSSQRYKIDIVLATSSTSPKAPSMASASIPKVYLVGATALLLSLIIAISVGSTIRQGAEHRSRNRKYKVAFIGNRFLAVNDLPRMMEAMSLGTWTQQSCLHSRGSLVSILETGNGMYTLWQTNAAYNLSLGVYDYGACTVEQLFQGSDGNLVYQNQNGAYYNDGRNPCFVSDDYFNFIDKQENQTMFDYVVFSDHAKRMAVETTRELALSELKNTYAKYLENDGAIPIIVSPHAFWSQNNNMTGMTDVATFTSLIYDGSLQYAQALQGVLPAAQKARIAPVSLAFLTVYEEDPDLWSQLTDVYDIHPSVFGSYLIGCVLYATITGMMPLQELGDDVESLFANARAMTGAVDWGYPDAEQAEYLREVARRVTKEGYKPATLELF